MRPTDSRSRVLEKWANYFKDLLNKNIEDTKIDCENIDEDTSSLAEVEHAIKKKKNNKASGADNINAELFLTAEETLYCV